MLIVGYLFLLIVLGLAASALMYAVYTRSRRKGYTPPLVALILTASWALGVAVGVRVIPGALPREDVHAFFLHIFFLPLLLSLAISTLAMLALPVRSARAFGARSVGFPLVTGGRSLIAIAALISLGAVIGTIGYGWKISLAVRALILAWGFLVPLGLYWLRLARRLKEPSVSEIIATDGRAPVLYLRPFNQESQFFVIGRKERYGGWAKSLHARWSQENQNIGITCEEYLADALNESIGPFLALGSPEDYVPPDGATRTYASDIGWKDRFRELAQRAICILVEVGRSGNLRWEFEQLRSDGLAQKLFVIIPPKRQPRTRLAWAFFELLWRLKGLKTVSWAEIAAELRKMGYDLGSVDPGPGGVIGFDRQGNGVIVATGADLPADFVGAIGKRLPDAVRRHHPAKRKPRRD